MSDSTKRNKETQEERRRRYVNSFLAKLNESASFEGVDLGHSVDLTTLVQTQLKYGTHRRRDDSRPADWLVDAWEAVNPVHQRRLSDAVHEALVSSDAKIRSEALSVLNMRPSMAQGDKLLEIADNRWHLFQSLSHRDSQKFIHLTASKAVGSGGSRFRRRMVTDATYGGSVLASLVANETDWVIANAAKIVGHKLDPQGERMGILVFAMYRQGASNLRRLVKQLAPFSYLRQRLTTAIMANVPPNAQAEFLALIR